MDIVPSPLRFIAHAWIAAISLIATVAAAEPVIAENLPTVTIRHADGTRTTNWRKTGTSVRTQDRKGTISTTTYLDADHPVSLRVCSLTYAGYPATAEWVEIINQGKAPIVLERFDSSAPIFHSPDGVWLKRNAGDWGNELNPMEMKVDKLIGFGSVRGTRASQDTPPFFFLSLGGAPQEDKGEIYAGTIIWNGNYIFEITPTSGGAQAHCGIHPQRSAYTLDAGKTFTAPKMLWVKGQNGMGELARTMQRFVRNEVLRDPKMPRPVLLNNWEATQMNFDEKKLVNLFDAAKETKFDLFLLDDGWFGGKYQRNNDATSTLGDWMVDTRKLPHGISYLCEEAKKRGLQFGIWVEPEMVSPKSELYEKHPEWAIPFEGDPWPQVRFQGILDLTRPETRAYAFKVVDDLLTQNPGISYLKWDCNRHMTQVKSTWLPADRQENLFIDYANVLDGMMAELAKKHPKVEMMLCAGGGGRVDFRSLSYFHEFWPSDNTDPYRRVKMQWEYSAIYPAISICAHVTHSGNRPLKFAFEVAMSGRLGADLDVTKMSEPDRKFTALAVDTYRRIVRPIVHLGEQYRLESPYAGPRAAMNFVAKDKASSVLFVYQLQNAEPAPVRLQGLDPATRYRLTELNVMEGTTPVLAAHGQVMTGETLMKDGITPPCRTSCQSVAVLLEKQPANPAK